MHDPRKESLLNELISKYESLVDKKELCDLNKLNFCPSQHIEPILLLKIEMLTQALAPEFFSFVLNALGGIGGVFGYMLQASQQRLNFYVGFKTAAGIKTAVEVLKSGLKSTYPGSKVIQLSLEESALVLDKLFNPNTYSTLTSVVVVPNNTSSSNAPINQKLIDLMHNEAFVAIFLASSAKTCNIRCLIKALEDLYTELTPFLGTEYEPTYSTSKTPSTQIAKSITESDANACTVTNAITRECSSTKGVAITPVTTVSPKDLPQLSVGIAYSESSGNDNTDAQSIAKQETKGSSVTKSNVSTSSNTTAYSDTIYFIKENKFIEDTLAKLTLMIERLNKISSEGVFYFGAYFLSQSQATSIRSAYTYSGLAKDSTLTGEGPFINSWEEEDCDFPKLVEEIRNFNHLSFLTPHNKQITTSVLISSLELLNSFYFPYTIYPL